MKKSVLFFLALFSVSLFFVACSNDDDDDNNDDPQTLAERFPGVPIGDIVPVAERETALVGDESTMKSGDESLKYWIFAQSTALISGCGISDEIDLLDQYGYTEDTKLAFGRDGNLYVKVDGNESVVGGWEWSDTQTKDGIILDTYPGVVFTFTILTPDEVVYASKQVGAYEGCSSTTIITYERMVYDGGGQVDPNGLTPDINEIITAEALEGLQDLGMPINTGTNPPNLEGAYLGSPFVLKSSNVPNDYDPGYQFADITIHFYEQNDEDLTIKYDYINGIETGVGQGGFIVGDDNNFSVFLGVEVEISGYSSDVVIVLSGTMGTDGIENLYFANFMVDNFGNPGGVFIPDNTGRIVYDSDGFSESTTWYTLKNAQQSNMPSINMVR